MNMFAADMNNYIESNVLLPRQVPSQNAAEKERPGPSPQSLKPQTFHLRKCRVTGIATEE